MTPTPDQDQPDQNQDQLSRYRSGMPGQPAAPGQMPAGGPPSFTGGTPSGSQPAGAGDQQRMQAPWMQGIGAAGQDQAASQNQNQMVAQQPQPTPNPMAGLLSQPQQQQAATQQRMQAPWTQNRGSNPNRPQYQGAPGAAQRQQMNGPQQPGQPTSMRQQAVGEQNRSGNLF